MITDYDFSLSPRDFVNKHRMIVCPSCKRENWEYIGSKVNYGDVVRADDFKGIEEVPDPKSGDDIVCHFCGEVIIYKA